MKLLKLVTITNALLLSCLSTLAAAATVVERPMVDITVEPGATSEWLATYHFSEPSAAWAFTRSSLSKANGGLWRAETWTVQTPGVRLERWRDQDVLVADKPIRAVSVRFQPYAKQLTSGHIPALIFSDGGLALLTGQFDVTPLAGRGEDLVSSESGGPPTRARLQVRARGRRLFVDGASFRDAVAVDPNAQAYVYLGHESLSPAAARARVMDPGLPDWIAADVTRQTSELMSWYGQRLGAPGGRPAILYAAWRRTEQGTGSMFGAVLNGAIAVSFEGKALESRSRVGEQLVSWFTAHEIAHLWLGQTLRPADSRGAWMTEGGADLLAVRAAQQLSSDFDARARLQLSLDDCADSLVPHQPPFGGADSTSHRAYDCGAVLLLAAEGALKRTAPDADALDFWRDLLERRRADRVVSEADWLDAFQRAGAGSELTGRLRSFLEVGAEDPRAFLHHLLVSAGVPVERRAEQLILR